MNLHKLEEVILKTELVQKAVSLVLPHRDFKLHFLSCVRLDIQCCCFYRPAMAVHWSFIWFSLIYDPDNSQVTRKRELSALFLLSLRVSVLHGGCLQALKPSWPCGDNGILDPVTVCKQLILVFLPKITSLTKINITRIYVLWGKRTRSRITILSTALQISCTGTSAFSSP